MRYVYATKPDYNPTTHNLYETYQLEGDVFHVNYMIQPKPDEDGYTPTPDEQPDGARRCGSGWTCWKAQLTILS